MLNRLGGQRVGIVRDVPVLDGAGHPVLDEFMVPLTTELTVWVDNCLFETQSTAEDSTAITTTTSEQAWCFMPVSGGQVPAVDDSGDPAPIAVTAFTSVTRVSCAGRDFQMIGDAVLEIDLDGREDHMFCLCERRRG